MNRVVLFTFFVLSAIVFCRSLQAQNMASIEVFYPKVSVVYGLDNHPVRYTQCKASVGFSFGEYVEFPFDPHRIKWHQIDYTFSVERRHYYNLIKRQLNGKKTLHKSANYLSVKPSYTLQQYKDKYERTINHKLYCSANWGLRRAIGKRFYFDGSIGVGPSYSTHSRTWSAMANVDLNFGFKLF